MTLLIFTESQKQKQTNLKKGTLPMKAEEPPNLDIPTATLAGAPPGAFLKPSASSRETPLTGGTKSINISPKQTINAGFLGVPFFSLRSDLDEPN